MLNASLHAYVSLSLHVDPCYIHSMVRPLRLLWVFGELLGIDCGIRDDEDFCWPLLTFCGVVRCTQVGLTIPCHSFCPDYASTTFMSL